MCVFVGAGVIVASPQSTFAHMDFTWGEDANSVVYADMIQLVAKYNPL